MAFVCSEMLNKIKQQTGIHETQLKPKYFGGEIILLSNFGRRSSTCLLTAKLACGATLEALTTQILQKSHNEQIFHSV